MVIEILGFFSKITGNRNFGFFFSKITGKRNFVFFSQITHLSECIFFLILFKYLQDFQHFTKNFTKIFPFPKFPLNFLSFYCRLLMSVSELQNFWECGLKKKIFENQRSMCPRV